MSDVNGAVTREAADVLVIGSVNIDRIARVSAFPKPGETIGSRAYTEVLGGKGLNQAVALARAGASTAMLGSVGDDPAGDLAVRVLAGERIDHRLVRRRATTGAAFILVADDGDNTITLVPGANATVSPADVDAAAAHIRSARLVLAQLEVPLPTVTRAAQESRRRATPFVLNAAPACELPDGLLEGIDTLIVNETELATIAAMPVSSLDEARAAGARLRERGARRLVVTLGGAGALLMDADSDVLIAAPAAVVEDTTGAGDVFVGTYCAHIAAGRGPRRAVEAAVEAASASVSVVGTPAAWAQRRLLGAGAP